MDEKATAEQVAQYQAELSDAELLELLNVELSRRKQVDPEVAAAAEQAKAAAAEYERFYPAKAAR